MKDILLVGEPMGMFMSSGFGSLFEAEHFTKGVAGAEVNVGIGLSRLKYSVEFVSKLGNDLLGKDILNFLQKENLGTEYVSFDSEHNTGSQMKSQVAEGDPEVAYFRKNSAFTTLSQADIMDIDFSKFRLFHVTGIPPAVSQTARESIRYLMKKARESGCQITFDPNLRPSLWEDTQTMVTELNELAGYADVVMPGISEGEILTGSSKPEDIAQFYLARGAKAVIIKNGADGAIVAQTNKETISVPGFKVEKVVDTVGAGDGFAVGVISALLDQASLQEAALRGNAIGSLQVQHRGDNEGLPTRDELMKYLEHNSAQEAIMID